VSSRYPKEALVFRDRDPRYSADVYEATDFEIGVFGGVIGLTCLIHKPSGDDVWDAFPTWIDIEFAVPLTPAAREFLAIARAMNGKDGG
jgi:hypothetical protein